MKKDQLKNTIHSNGENTHLSLEDALPQSSTRSQYNALQTLDELLARDQQREIDGFERKIKLGKIVKPSENESDEIVIVPTTVETKFYHDTKACHVYLTSRLEYLEKSFAN